VRVWDLTAQAHTIERWRNEAATAVAVQGGDGEAVELARLAVSELLSNVVKHVSDPRCQLVVECQDGFVRLKVLDRSTAVPAITVPDWRAESGRGLWLLQALAPDWGYICHPGGKSVWVRFALTDSGRVGV
jgi:serine/threonine-protein kinase RsbW